MHFRRCFVVLGIVVHLLEGTSITTVSQTEATSLTSTIEVDITTAFQKASSARPTSPSTIEVNLTTAFRTEATSARPTTSTNTTEVNLTTGFRTEVTSARPTSLLRRIDVRKEDYVKRTTDIFYRRRASNNRSLRQGLYENMGQWDYWCMLQPITGNCGRNSTKYYYNQQVNECLPHVFTGCKNIRNQFESIEDCHSYCKGSALMPMHVPQNTLRDLCKLQPISGRCLGQEIMYYYDVNENTCKTFVYGGCAGNDNKFYDKEACLNRCAVKVTTTARPNYDYLN